MLCLRFCVQWRKSLNLLTFVCEIYLLRTTKIENCQQFLLSWIVCCSFDDYPSCREGEGCLPLGKFCVPFTFANKVYNTNKTDLRLVFPTQLSPYQKNLKYPTPGVSTRYCAMCASVNSRHVWSNSELWGPKASF